MLFRSLPRKLQNPFSGRPILEFGWLKEISGGGLESREPKVFVLEQDGRVRDVIVELDGGESIEDNSSQRYR